MTKVINLLAGSGCGKSTTAAALFAEMKLRGYHVEQVTEFVKKWAWQSRTPTGLDQVYIFGKQAQSESVLYGKVDYIVTDSPVLLSGYYEHHHLKEEITLPAILNFLDYSKRKHDVEHLNFFLKRNKKFDTRGRYETEDQAIYVDADMRIWLDNLGIPFKNVDVSDRDRVEYILSHLEAPKGVKGE